MCNNIHPSNEKHIHCRYWYFVDNLQECAGENGEIFLYFALPINHTGQRVENMKIVPAPVDIVEDKVNGNRFLIWKRLGADKSGPMIFYYDFDLYNTEVNLVPDPDIAKPYDTQSPQYLRNIISEGWLDISEAVKNKAAQITTGEDNPARKAKKIYDWLATHLKYEYIDTPARGASKTLARLKGDCGEFSALFVAMCRACRIPARTVTCNWLVPGGHQWAEFLLPPYGWIPVDPTIAHFMHSEPDGRVTQLLRKIGGFQTSNPDWFFGNLYPDRIMVQIGENVVISSEKAGVHDAAFYLLQPGGQEAIPAACEFKGFSRQAVECGIYVVGDKHDDAAYARSQLYRAFGEAFVRVKAYEKAEAELKLAIKANTQDGYAWLLLGQAQFGMKNYSTAIESFMAALAGQGGSLKSVWDAVAHFHIGNCHDIMGNRAQALHEYSQVVSSDVSYENLQQRARRHIKTPYSG